jgi:hypothetical protein
MRNKQSGLCPPKRLQTCNDLFGHQQLNLPDLTEPKGQQVCNMSTHADIKPARICCKDSHFYVTKSLLTYFQTAFFAAKKKQACAKLKHKAEDFQIDNLKNRGECF